VPGTTRPASATGKIGENNMAKKAKTAAKTRILDSMRLVVLKRENPFTAKVQAKHAAACLASHGKLVSEAKKRDCDSWTLRQLVDRKIVKVQQVEA
jgi:hypothetical protein